MALAGGKAVTKYLRLLAQEAETVADDGSIVTKAEALAQLVLQHALGFERRDPDDPNKSILVPPAQWAIQLVFDRLEGKVPMVTDEATGKVSAADKIGELNVNRVNAMSVAITDGDVGGPPEYKKGPDE